MPDTALPYANLTPSLILDAVEACGFQASGALLALNSYENRVYQVGLDDGSFLVTKIYRPGRWSDAAILEEHAFAQELAELEIPVVAPLPLAEGGTLLHYADYRLALYPRRGGRPPSWKIPNTCAGWAACWAASMPAAASACSASGPG